MPALNTSKPRNKSALAHYASQKQFNSLLATTMILHNSQPIKYRINNNRKLNKTEWSKKGTLRVHHKISMPSSP